jgi:hypothetical protein
VRQNAELRGRLAKLEEEALRLKRQGQGQVRQLLPRWLAVAGGLS